jgi:hypothetical protein
MSVIGMNFDIWTRLAQRAFDSMIPAETLAPHSAVQD